MSYYRNPDDLPGVDPAAPPAAPGPVVPPAVPAGQVVGAAGGDETRRKRKQLIIGLCVAVDLVILAIVLAIFFG